MKKQILKIIFIMFMVVLLLPAISTFATGTVPEFNTKWESVDSLPSENGSYYLDKDITITETWEVPNGITNLNLNGHCIKLADDKSGSVINISSRSTLNLYEQGEGNHKFTVDESTGLWTLNEANGSEAVIRGVITGGKGTGTSGTNGGAVYISAGGTFNMYGGIIAGNKATKTSDGGGCGSAVYSDGGSFNMYGGSIIGNTAVYGSIYIERSEVKSTITEGWIEQNTTSFGGGLYIGNRGLLEMNGGHIENNTSKQLGGGVYLYGGNFKMIGGTIMNNVATDGGGGINYTSGNLSLGGTAQIIYNKKGEDANNVSLGKGKIITLEEIDKISNEMQVGITNLDASQNHAPGQITTNGTEDDLKYFESDDQWYEPQYNVNGYIELLPVYPIWVGDIQVTEHNKNDVLGEKDSGATVTYDSATQTLTLNNAIIETGRKINKEGTYQAYWTGIYTTIDLNIQLKGNNSIGEIDEAKYNVANGYATYGYSVNYGIWADDKDLALVESDGKGTLKIIDRSDGIKAKNITFNDKFGKLQIDDLGETPSEDVPPCAISATESVTINGGEFDLKSENQNGISADKIIINGGTIKIEAKDSDIKAFSELDISDDLEVINVDYIKGETKELNVENGYLAVEPVKIYVTVTFETNGGSSIVEQKIIKYNKITNLTEPTKDGFVFGGWFTDESLTTQFDLDSPVSSDITLYAKWIEKDEEVEENTIDTNTENPKTGDIKVEMWIALMVISSVGIILTTKKHSGKHF